MTFAFSKNRGKARYHRNAMLTSPERQRRVLLLRRGRFGLVSAFSFPIMIQKKRDDRQVSARPGRWDFVAGGLADGSTMGTMAPLLRGDGQGARRRRSVFPLHRTGGRRRPRSPDRPAHAVERRGAQPLSVQQRPSPHRPAPAQGTSR